MAKSPKSYAANARTFLRPINISGRGDGSADGFRARPGFSQRWIQQLCDNATDICMYMFPIDLPGLT